MNSVGQEFGGDRVETVSLYSVISGTTVQGESTTGAQSNLEASSFTGLAVDAGCQQRPQLGCELECLRMFFPCHFSVGYFGLFYSMIPGFHV